MIEPLRPLVLPESSAFSHVTAALAHDFSLHDPSPNDLIWTSSPPPTGHSVDDPDGSDTAAPELRTMVMVNDLPVTDAIDTWCDLATLAVGRSVHWIWIDLIVIGDEVLNEVIRRELAGSNRSALGHAQRATSTHWSSIRHSP